MPNVSSSRASRLRFWLPVACALSFVGPPTADAASKYGPGASDTEIRIGQTMPYSGPLSAFGTIGRAQMAYFEMVNAQGGVNGRKIRLISLDDGYSPPKTIEQTRKLVESDEVLPTGNRPCASCAIKHPDDWKRIRVLDPGTAAGWVEEIETIIRLGFDRRIGDAPVLPTLFSPLSLARKLSGERLAHDLREHPAAVAAALEAITETLVKFADLALREGVSGIFYSIQTASRRVERMPFHINDPEFANAAVAAFHQISN